MILIIGTDSTHTKFFLTAGKSLNIPMFVWSNDFDEVKKLNIDFNLQFVSRELETCLDKASGVLVANRFGEDHFAPAKKVLLAKKPVFVDKPLVINVDQAVELEKLGEKLDVLLMSGSPLNFSEIYADLENLSLAKVLKEKNFEEIGSIINKYIDMKISNETNIKDYFDLNTKQLSSIIDMVEEC